MSRATETIVEGQASTVADGLRQHGYWCVQPRSNDLTVQIACRSPQRDVRGDVIAARDGAVVYADVDLRVMATSSLDAERRLDRILQAAFYQLWPQERQTVEDLLEDARSARSMPFGQQAAPMDPAEQYSTHDQRGIDISWSLRARYTGEPLALRLRSDGLEDRTWPLGGQHDATSINVATAALSAEGFSCTDGSCSRASPGQGVDFDTHDGQVVAARFTLRSSGDPSERLTDPAGRWIDAGLPFLTAEVRTAVDDRVQRSRLEHRSWRGVVAGAPVDIVAVPGGSVTPDGRSAQDLTIEIGIPLLAVE